MALVKCSECGHDVSDKATLCQNCGYPMVAVCELKSPVPNDEQSEPEQSVITPMIVHPSDGEKGVSDQNREKRSKMGVFKKTWFAILMLFLFFPVGVFLIWKYKEFHVAVRIIASVLFCVHFLFWTLVFAALVMPCGHEWEPATCTEPSTCQICGEVDGGKLGHNWVDATYSTPKTCLTCGLTKGDSLERQDTIPTTANIENEIEFVTSLFYQRRSKVLAEFPNATEEGTTLIIAGTFVGMNGQYKIFSYDDKVERIIFIRDNGVVVTDDVIDGLSECLGDYVEYDKDWNEYVWKTDKLKLSLYVDERVYFDPADEWDIPDNEEKDETTNTQEVYTVNGCFTYTARSFMERFDESYDDINGFNYAYARTSGDNLYYELIDIENGFKTVGIVGFDDDDGNALPIEDDFTENIICSVTALVEEVDDVPMILVGCMCAADPSLDFMTAYSIGESVVECAGKEEGYTYNNINYVIVTDDEYYYIIMSVVSSGDGNNVDNNTNENLVESTAYALNFAEFEVPNYFVNTDANGNWMWFEHEDNRNDRIGVEVETIADYMKIDTGDGKTIITAKDTVDFYIYATAATSIQPKSKAMSVATSVRFYRDGRKSPR